MIKIKKTIYNNKMSVLMIHNRNQRTAWWHGLAALRLCFFTGDEVEGGVGSQREGLSGVSSLTLALNSRMALCAQYFLVHSFVPDLSQTLTIPRAQILFGDAAYRWLNPPRETLLWVCFHISVLLFRFNSTHLNVLWFYPTVALPQPCREWVHFSLLLVLLLKSE